MKKINIIIFVIVLLAVIGVLLVTSKSYTTLENEDSSFAVEDTAAITKIFIADKNDNQVLLTRKGNGWILNKKYQVNQGNMKILLGTLKRLKVKAPVSIAKHDNVIRRMAATGRKVEIYQMAYRVDLFNRIKLFRYEKLVKVFYVGGATQNNLGTNMLMEGAERPYVVFLPSLRGYLTTRFSPMPDDWKSHVVFNNKLSDIKSVKLEFGRDPESSFIVDIVDGLGNYKLTQSITGKQVENYDTLKLLNFLTSFSDLRYETRLNNIKPKATIDSIIHSPKLYQLTLVDQEMDTTIVKMYEKKEAEPEEVDLDIALIPIDHDRFYGLINRGEDFVLMQYFVFDNVLKPLSYYER